MKKLTKSNKWKTIVDFTEGGKKKGIKAEKLMKAMKKMKAKNTIQIVPTSILKFLEKTIKPVEQALIELGEAYNEPNEKKRDGHIIRATDYIERANEQIALNWH